MIHIQLSSFCSVIYSFIFKNFRIVKASLNSSRCTLKKCGERESCSSNNFSIRLYVFFFVWVKCCFSIYFDFRMWCDLVTKFVHLLDRSSIHLSVYPSLESPVLQVKFQADAWDVVICMPSFWSFKLKFEPWDLTLKWKFKFEVFSWRWSGKFRLKFHIKV